MSVQDAHGATPPRIAAPFAAILGAELAKRSRAFARAAQRLAAPDDAEAVHDVRVVSRRLEAALWLWRGQYDPAARRKAARQLRRLRRRLGRARELEVHAALLRAHLEDERGDARLAAEPLLARWERRALRAKRAAVAWIGATRVRRIRARIERALVTDQARPDPLGAARERLGRRRESANDAIQRALTHPGEKPFHRARIAVKKLRYAAESFAAVTGSEPQPLTALRDLQQALGDLHDATLLEGRVGRHHAKLHGRGLAGHAAALQELHASLGRRRHAEEDRVRQLVRWSSPRTLPIGGGA
jgi:CHAD domain-containing protein